MIEDSKQLRAREYISHLGTIGRHHFTSAEARAALGVSAKAAIASPARGFHVVVPPEHRKLGCLPAEHFIPALMNREELPYYAGLLSAAQFHGAGHHRPQEFQVMLGRPRRNIKCGKVRVSFHVRKNLSAVATKGLNTPRGSILVSTPEATAMDLVGYQNRVGGLDLVATALSELAEQMEPDHVLNAAQTAPVAWAQRLGFLLDSVEREGLTSPLAEYVQARVRNFAPLLPASPRHRAGRNAKWKLIVNADVETEL